MPYCIVLLILGIVFGAPSSFAHRPYIDVAIDCQLPDGGAGRLMVVRGDGILFTDPASVLLVNSENRVVAFSQAESYIVLYSDASNLCRAWAIGKGIVFVPDRLDFQSHAVVTDERHQDILYEFVSEQSRWGIVERAVQPADFFQAFVPMLGQARSAIFSHFLLGLFCALLIVIVKKWNKQKLLFWRILRYLVLYSVYALVSIIIIICLIAPFQHQTYPLICYTALFFGLCSTELIRGVTHRIWRVSV